MPLVSTKKMFEMAYNNGYAVGAFNVNNMEITQGIIQAVAEEKAPLILQVSRGAREYASNSYLMGIINVAVKENPDIPIATHLDHGDNFETCKQFVDDGFTSVMIDASKLPFEENIKVAKEVVEYAHKHGVVVEAELGEPGSEAVPAGVTARLYRRDLSEGECCLLAAMGLGEGCRLVVRSHGDPCIDHQRALLIGDQGVDVQLADFR